MADNNSHRQSSQNNEPPRTFGTFIKNGIWAYKVLFSLSKRDAILQIFLIAANAVFPTALAYSSARLLDEVVALVNARDTSISEISLTSPIVVTLLLLVGLMLLNRATASLERYIDSKIQQYHMERYRLQLYAKISELDVIQFEDPTISNDILRSGENFYKITIFIRSSLDSFSSIISTVISAVITFTISPVISVLTILLSLPNNIVYGWFTRTYWKFYNKYSETNTKIWRLRDSLVSELAIPEHRITQSHQYINKKTEQLFQVRQKEQLSIYQTTLKWSLLGNLLNALTYIVSPLFLINLILQGKITVGQFTFYQRKFMDLSSELESSFGNMISLTDTAAYLSYVRNIFEIKTIIKSGRKNISAKRIPKIEFVDVSFKYPRSTRYALKNISLTINPNEEIAIVGENGAGKTTLIKLLLRFYEPESGQILIDGTPLAEYSLSQYYELFGTLFQEFNRYGPLTAKENIIVGDHTRPFSKKRLQKAAKQGDAQDFIEHLPNTYDQILHKRFTGGTELSTGQWQKLALARMFYRDRPVLILDEPTASIDAEAEFRIFERIYNFTENKTVIIISHRFSTVRNAKRIYVLNKGELVEQGSHEELMKRNGRYARAFNMQAKGYQKKETQ